MKGRTEPSIGGANNLTKNLIDKSLENSLHFVFQKMDAEKKNSLTYDQFTEFLRINSFDFMLDFFEKDFITKSIFVTPDPHND